MIINRRLAGKTITKTAGVERPFYNVECPESILQTMLTHLDSTECEPSEQASQPSENDSSTPEPDLVPYGNEVVPSNGAILFGSPAARERYFPDARVSCALFAGVCKGQRCQVYTSDVTAGQF